MSEDDRALKAARAKALLKKRQQQKAGATTAETASPSLPPSRTSTPAPPSQQVLGPGPESEKRDVGDLFSQDNSDSSWLSSLPRAPSPPHPARVIPPAAPKSPPANGSAYPTHSNANGQEAALKSELASLQSQISSLREELKRFQSVEPKLHEAEARLVEEENKFNTLSKQFQEFQAEKGGVIQNERQTVALLVSEKASLISELQRLEKLESEAQASTQAFNEERQKVEGLESRLRGLQVDAQEASKRAQSSETQVKDLTERCRDQERQLQLANASVNELRQESNRHQQKVRELQEQILNDDRVEKLEISLKNTQNRADDLEFQLSKLTQIHTTLKAERDNIEAERQRSQGEALEWKDKYTESEKQHEDLLDQLETVSTAKHTLSQANTQLQDDLEASRKAATELEKKFEQASADLASSNRHLQGLQQELKTANRRADEAERTQRDLQSEGTTLMRSLDEMRPKIVELTTAKAELAETIDSLQHTIRNRDNTISQLEATVDELRDQKDQSISDLDARFITQGKQLVQLTLDNTELQKATSELKEELESTLASLQNLETERASHHQETSRRLDDINRLSTLSRTQSQDLDALRRRLDEQGQEQEEEQDMLEQAQNEIEALRLELLSKDEEIERLRHSSVSPTAGAAQSLDSELFSSLKQQHALELSSSQSQIRALEDSVFQAEAKSHALQKQVSALEDQLAHARSAVPRSFSPGVPSRPSSRAALSDGRGASTGSHRPSHLGAPPILRPAFDQDLSPDTLHKRKVSLSMLKARMDSETAAKSHPSTRAVTPIPHPLPTIHEPTSKTRSPTHHRHHHHRPQFMDEAHIFWCHGCRGDLVVL